MENLENAKKRIYRIDHYYFYDSNKSCLLIESDLEPNVLAKILVAIQFKLEELVCESLDIDFSHLLDILKKFYKVKDVKDEYKNILNKTDDYECEYEYDDDEYDDYGYIYEFNLEGIKVIKIELYSARDNYCGENFRDVYKYLVEEKKIEDMVSDIMKYPKGYKEYIEHLSEKEIKELSNE